VNVAASRAWRSGRVVLRLLAFAVAALLVVAGVASCDRFGAITVRNNTTVLLHFYVVGTDGAKFPLVSTVASGASGAVIYGGNFNNGSLITRNGCTVGDLVALDPTGREVARKAPPLCANDTWTVNST
jgi:hypothetical protein